jgi:hypothetical protein
MIRDRSFRALLAGFSTAYFTCQRVISSEGSAQAA